MKLGLLTIFYSKRIAIKLTDKIAKEAYNRNSQVLYFVINLI